MSQEIERKFLVKSDAYRQLGKPTFYAQGYIQKDKGSVVRVRIAHDKGYLTVKGTVSALRRLEYEYEIPLADAQEMLDLLCEKPLIEKHRYNILCGSIVWEVDEFHGENEGLVVAEVELPDEQYPLELPEWVGEEVSEDSRYLNANLVDFPFSKW